MRPRINKKGREILQNSKSSSNLMKTLIQNEKELHEGKDAFFIHKDKKIAVIKTTSELNKKLLNKKHNN